MSESHFISNNLLMNLSKTVLIVFPLPQRLMDLILRGLPDVIMNSQPYEE